MEGNSQLPVEGRIVFRVFNEAEFRSGADERKLVKELESGLDSERGAGN